MDLRKIEERVLFLSPYVKEIAVVTYDNSPFAYIYPDFERLKKANIINIEEEIRWYAVELYNMEVEKPQKIRGYKVFTHPLPRTASKAFDTAKLRELALIDEDESCLHKEAEPDDETYKAIKTFLSELSENEICLKSHLELDLGLDSLDYVELFIFIERSFGVKIDEMIFSKMMSMQDLYSYVKEHQTHNDPFKVKWKDILDEPIDEKLIYSPYIMYMYKTLILPISKLYFRLEVIGKENIPSYPCIIAPSHQSMLDGFLIEATLPYKVLKRTFFLAYKQVFGRSFLDIISKHGQSILIDANEHLKHTIQCTALPLKSGNNLVVFPEGARSRDRELLDFRPFFAMLSKTFNVPVVPVVIDGTFEALETGKLFPRPKKVRITYLKPISPDGLNPRELTARVKEAIYNEMKKNPVLLK